MTDDCRADLIRWARAVATLAPAEMKVAVQAFGDALDAPPAAVDEPPSED